MDRNPTVRWYRKDSCEEYERGQQWSHLKFVAYHRTYTFFTGITLIDVIELEWLTGKPEPEERYFYAKDWGLVGWQSIDGRNAGISEIHAPGARPDNVREVIGCL